MKPEITQKIVQKVKNDYDIIASEIDRTRQYLWPGLESFKNYVKPGDKILDAGCGNGKLRLLFKDVKIRYFGIDNSQKLLVLAQQSDKFRLAEQKFLLADIYQLPFADNFFDVIFCLAVFHHLPGKPLRSKTLNELKRVLKPGGRLIMTNWNRWQTKYLYYIIRHTLLKLMGQSYLDFKDILLPWGDGKVKRYFHAFTLGELKKLFTKDNFDLEQNRLTYWHKPAHPFPWPFSYLRAANLVTVAKK